MLHREHTNNITPCNIKDDEFFGYINTTRNKVVRIFAVFIFFASTAVGQKTDYQLVRNLNQQWLCFDNSYNNYTAYTENLHQNSRMIHFWLKPEQWKSYYLLLHLQEEAYFFINHNIQKKIPKGRTYFSLDSLAKIYPRENIFVSIYAHKANFLKETLIINQVPKFNPNILANENTKSRAFQNLLKSRASIFLIVLLSVYAFMRQYDSKLLLAYLQVSKFLQIQRRLDNPLFLRFFQNSNVLFLLIYIALLTTFFVILEAIAPSNEPFVLGKYINSLSAYKLSWVNVLIWYLLLLFGLVGKYFIIFFTSNLLGLSRLISIHFYEYIRITHWFFVPLTATSLLLCLHFPYQMDYWYDWLKYLLLLVYIVRLLATTYNINSFTEFRKLDFYSYLCISEIIPLLVYVKILFFT
jgi:hypothetical protein